jgi:tetratricopeptide (TPR) repeat protein
MGLAVADLREMGDVRLDGQLESWRRYRDGGRATHANSLPPDIRDLATSVPELFGWTDDRARAAGQTALVPGGTPSMGGPAGLYQLAEAVGRGELSWTVASNAASALGVGDDDVMFLVAFAAKDPRHHDPSTAGAMMRLAGEVVQDDALGARLLRMLAALVPDRIEQFALLRQADDRLTAGADDRLRAEVWNEMAILKVTGGDFEGGRALAEDAMKLALATGDAGIANMALGNQGFALMQMGRFAQAIDVFERLADQQQRAGDLSGLAATRENLEVCRANLHATS